jgi:hypothetical protein
LLAAFRYSPKDAIKPANDLDLITRGKREFYESLL